MELFGAEETTIRPSLPDADVLFMPDFLEQALAVDCFRQLFNETPWRQDDIKVFGKVYPQPRLTALYGEAGKPYSYSGITMDPLPFTPLLNELKQKVETVSKITFNTVLLNLYRDGKDSNGWHSDDEKELGANPAIASLSLGSTRRFHLRHKHSDERFALELTHGSLLLMQGSTQHFWKHQIPKSKKITEPRINLTFRYVYSR